MAKSFIYIHYFSLYRHNRHGYEPVYESNTMIIRKIYNTVRNNKFMEDSSPVSPEMILELKKKLANAKTEEDVKMVLGSFIDQKIEKWNLKPAKYEHRLEISGERPDALYEKVIVEYKAPGYLSKLNFYEVADQVKGYIENLSKELGLKKWMFFSAILDGQKIGFIRYSEVEEKWIETIPQEINDFNINKLLNSIRGLKRKGLTAENIVQDFGPNSNIGKNLITAFYKTEINSPRSQVLKDEWFYTFKQIVSYNYKSIGELTKQYGIEAKTEEEFEKILFSVQTYFALLMKLIVAEVISNYSEGKLSRSYLQELKASNNIKIELTELENEGGFFQKFFRIRNFLEGNYFSWYLDEWNSNIESGILMMIETLSDYESATTDLKPEKIRDLFKILYQNLIPKKLRHDFGEYYTPDWLAELLIKESGILENKDIINKRFLDPACGSGTFIINIIKLFKIKMEEQNLDRREVASKIFMNIVGYDLNPIAVLASRANFIIGVGDLIRERKGEIEIPIYLADSVGLIKHFDTSFENEKFKKTKNYTIRTYYIIRTVVSDFIVPESLVLNGRFEKSLIFAKNSLEIKENVQKYIDIVKQKVGSLDETEEESLKKIYDKLLKLELEGKNKIWVSLLRNTFAPLLKGKFDYVLGNPPWINWESLPEDYREQTKEIWVYYGLSNDKNSKKENKNLKERKVGRLGKVKKDFSMLFIVVSLKNYLSNDGILAMLCPYTLFKVTAGSEFRFLISGKKTFNNEEFPVKVIKILDLVEIKPFEDSTTRTAGIIIKKGAKTEFPINVEMWRPKSVIKPNFPLEEVIEKSERYPMKFFPMSEYDVSSPWFMLNETAFYGLKKVIGKSDYIAHEGVNTGLNEAYWVELIKKENDLTFIRNLNNVGKIKVPKIEEWIEESLLYPLIRGRDIKEFISSPSGFIIVPHDKVTGKCIMENEFRQLFPFTYRYLLKIKDNLLDRSAYKLLGKSLPFYSLFDISSYSFSKYKVAWAYVSGNISGKALLRAGLIEPNEDKVVIPNEKCIFISTEDYYEALYILGVLNSSISKLIVASYSIETHIAPDIMNVIRIIKYDKNNKDHLSIAEIVKKIINKILSKENISELKLELDKMVANLYGISQEELDNIRRDLSVLLNISENNKNIDLNYEDLEDEDLQD